MAEEAVTLRFDGKDIRGSVSLRRQANGAELFVNGQRIGLVYMRYQDTPIQRRACFMVDSARDDPETFALIEWYEDGLNLEVFRPPRNLEITDTYDSLQITYAVRRPGSITAEITGNDLVGECWIIVYDGMNATEIVGEVIRSKEGEIVGVDPSRSPLLARAANKLLDRLDLNWGDLADLLIEDEKKNG